MDVWMRSMEQTILMHSDILNKTGNDVTTYGLQMDNPK